MVQLIATVQLIPFSILKGFCINFYKNANLYLYYLGQNNEITNKFDATFDEMLYQFFFMRLVLVALWFTIFVLLLLLMLFGDTFFLLAGFDHVGLTFFLT